MQNNKIKILNDDEEDQPVLGFEPLGRCIINTIMGSDPKLCIGIYGEWGTGKTTLMKFIEAGLKNHEPQVLSLWFNAWRYEREENLAITALLKSIAYAMENHPIYGELKPIILRSIKVITKGLLSELASKLISRETVNEIREGLEKKSLPYLDLLAEVDKDTIYFDGLNKIEGEMTKILKQDKYPTSRVVVFIDDLDRCSPRKTLEVFESVKVFLNIIGFVFVIGLSHDSISKLIDAEYKPSGIRGSQYIRKIIQIPIILPEWKSTDAEAILDNLIRKNKVDPNYSALLTKNKSALASVVEPNPREIKRFINNFIITNELFSGQLGRDIRKRELLIVQALRFRWYSFYVRFSSDEELRMLIREILSLNIRYEYLVKIINNSELFSAYLQSKETKSQETADTLLPSVRDMIKLKSDEPGQLGQSFQRAESNLVERGFDKDTVAELLRSIYDLIPKNEPFSRFATDERNLEKNIITAEEKIKELDRMIREKEGNPTESLKKFRDLYSTVLLEMDTYLMEFLREQSESIYSIANWDDYRGAAEFSKDIPVPDTPGGNAGAAEQVGNVRSISSQIDEDTLRGIWTTLPTQLCNRHREMARNIKPSDDNPRPTDWKIEDLRKEHYNGGYPDSVYFRRHITELARRHPEIHVEGDVIRLTDQGLIFCERNVRGFQRLLSPSSL